MRKVFQEFDADQGITSTVHEDETRTVIQKTYDAEPLLEYAKGLREATEGQRWGEGRIVGTVPMAVCAQLMRQDGRLDADENRFGDLQFAVGGIKHRQAQHHQRARQHEQ